MGCAVPGAEVRIGSRDAERSRVIATIELRSARANCPVLVHDLSASGARFESQSACFARGDIVQLRLPFLPAEQSAEVAWVKGAHTGVRFLSRLDAETFGFLSRAMRPADADVPLATVGPETVAPALPPAPPAGEARQLERAEVAIGAACRTESGRRGFVAMVDLTPQGCCLFSPTVALAPAQRLTLQPEGLASLKATVKWSKGSLVGVLFDHALYPAVFSHLTTTNPWPLPEAVKDALGPTGQVSDAAHRALQRMIERAEKQLRGRDDSRDVMSTRPPTVGRRPGIASRVADSNLARLFLG